MIKHAHAERCLEVTIRVSGHDIEERLLADIAAFNAQVEFAARAKGPEATWLARLT